MSQRSTFDELDDEWDDFTPSLHDRLFEDIQIDEMNVENNNRRSSFSDTEIDLPSDTDYGRALFSVFLDELIPSNITPKPIKKKQPLGEISTNQQLKAPTATQNEKQNSTCTIETKEASRIHPPTLESMNSQDAIWPDFDVDSFAYIENTVKLNQYEANNSDYDALNTRHDETLTPLNDIYAIENATAKPELRSINSLENGFSLPSKEAKKEAAASFIMPVMSGFATASGKKLAPVSEKAKRLALNLMKDIDPSSLDVKQPLPDFDQPKIKTSGFQTASGKELGPISEAAKQKALAMFNDLETSVLPSPPSPPPFKAFATASGKPIKAPSEASIKETLKLFEKIAVVNEEERHHGQKRPSSEPLNEQLRYDEIAQNPAGFDKKKAQRSFESKKMVLEMTEADSTVPSAVVNNKHNTIPVVPEQKLDGDGIVAYNSTSPEKQLLSKLTHKKVSVAKKQNKPFKSPIIHSNIERTKAAVSSRNVGKMKGKAVFDLTAPKHRYKLSALGTPGEFNQQQLLAMNISVDIVNMTSTNARNYMFDGNWGPKQAEKEMIEAGCLAQRLTMPWIINHYGLIVWKIACMVRSYPDVFESDWKPKNVLDQLLYRYEREINMGHRPVLRKVMEQDDISVKHMILMISDILSIKKPLSYNTSSKYYIMLSDGWYQVPVCIDLRIERAIGSKKLKVGHKLSVCGAQLVGDKTAQSPLGITNNSTLLSITANGCLPAHWDAKLGYHQKKLIMRSMPTIFDDGGIVTALDVVVCRKFPILYSETLPNGTSITRTAKEEEEARHRSYGGLLRQQSVDIPNFRADSRANNATLDRTSHESKTPEERRVSGHFKLRICDANSRSGNCPLATLLLSNANELNHMDISEGDRYRIFFVMPYHPKNKKYPGLDLKTTRMTRWEPASTLASLPSTYIPRFLTPCSGIHHQEDKSSDIDLVVLILSSNTPTLETMNGRKLWFQTLLVTDQSGGICQLHLRFPLNAPNDSKGQIIGFINVRFEMYDSKFDITSLKGSDETEIISKASTQHEYMSKGFQQLRSWIDSNPNEVKLLYERVKNISQ